MKKGIYLFFAMVGLIVPYFFLIRFLSSNGFDIPLLIGQLFTNDISTFFAVDLILSIILFWFFVQAETSRLGMKNGWLYVLASLTVGLSFALPLFLYFRERKLATG